MFEWLINLPVWLQTPLMVAVVLLIAAIVGWGLNALMWKVIPPNHEERAMLGIDNVPDQPTSAADPERTSPERTAQQEASPQESTPRKDR